jgi:hypothetical protein
LSLLIRWAQRARCQAETPLIGLFRFLRPALGPDRKPLLIGIDGADGVGKSSLASWLGWQLGAPALHLDLYLLRDGRSLKWRTDELKLLVQARLGRQQPLIVEGITLLDVLDQIGATSDFLAYVCGEGGYGLSELLSEYRSRQKPEQRAHFTLSGFNETCPLS